MKRTSSPTPITSSASRFRNRLGDSICSTTTEGDIDIADLVGRKSLSRISRFLGSNTSLNSSGPPGRKRARTRPANTPDQEVASARAHLNKSGQWAYVDELLVEEKQQLSTYIDRVKSFQQRDNSRSASRANSSFNTSIDAAQSEMPVAAENTGSAGGAPPDGEADLSKVEKDESTLLRRQKELDRVKTTKCYFRYISELPRELREVHHPRTPNKFRKYSRRAWDGLIGVWRKQIHAFGTDLGADTCACGIKGNAPGTPSLSRAPSMRALDASGSGSLLCTPASQRSCSLVSSETESGADRSASASGSRRSSSEFPAPPTPSRQQHHQKEERAASRASQASNQSQTSSVTGTPQRQLPPRLAKLKQNRTHDASGAGDTSTEDFPSILATPGTSRSDLDTSASFSTPQPARNFGSTAAGSSASTRAEPVKVKDFAAAAFNFFHQSHGGNCGSSASNAVPSLTFGIEMNEMKAATPPVAQRTRQQTANANQRLGFSEPRDIKRKLLVDAASDEAQSAMAQPEHASVLTTSGPAPKSPKADSKRVRQMAKRATNCMAIMEEDETTLTGRLQHSAQAAAALGSPVRSARQQAMLESTRRVLLEAEVDSCTLTDSTAAAAGLSSPSKATGGAQHTELTLDLRSFGLNSGAAGSSLFEQPSPSGGRVTRSLAHKTASPSKAKSPAKSSASIAFPSVSLGFSRSYASTLLANPAASNPSAPALGHPKVSAALDPKSSSADAGGAVAAHLRARPSQNLITKYATVAAAHSGKHANK